MYSWSAAWIFDAEISTTKHLLFIIDCLWIESWEVYVMDKFS